jgi:hypothetical protein
MSMDRTDYRYNLEYRTNARARMLTVARGVVSGDLSCIAAARQPRPIDGVEPEISAILDVFIGIHSETDALPIGKERAFWNREALARKDEEIKAAEERWRGRALDAAEQLVRLLEHR